MGCAQSSPRAAQWSPKTGPASKPNPNGAVVKGDPAIGSTVRSLSSSQVSLISPRRTGSVAEEHSVYSTTKSVSTFESDTATTKTAARRSERAGGSRADADAACTPVRRSRCASNSSPNKTEGDADTSPHSKPAAKGQTYLTAPLASPRSRRAASDRRRRERSKALPTSALKCLECLAKLDPSGPLPVCPDVALGEAYVVGDVSVINLWTAAATAVYSLLDERHVRENSRVTAGFSEQLGSLGPNLISQVFSCAKEEGGPFTTLSGKVAYLETFAIITAVCFRLNLTAANLTHAIFLLERTVAAGAAVTPHTLRPLLLTALLLSCKNYFDEVFRESDLLTAVPQLDFRPLAKYERRMLRLLEFRVSELAFKTKGGRIATQLFRLSRIPDESTTRFINSAACREIQRWMATVE